MTHFSQTDTKLKKKKKRASSRSKRVRVPDEPVWAPCVCTCSPRTCRHKPSYRSLAWTCTPSSARCRPLVSCWRLACSSSPAAAAPNPSGTFWCVSSSCRGEKTNKHWFKHKKNKTAQGETGWPQRNPADEFAHQGGMLHIGRESLQKIARRKVAISVTIRYFSMSTEQQRKV